MMLRVLMSWYWCWVVRRADVRIIVSGIGIRISRIWSETLITPQRFRFSDQIAGWREGQGPQLLLIHGVGMRAEYWSNIADDLKRSFTLTLIDMPGHGESPVYATPNPALTDYTDSIASLLIESDEPTFVVGHSMGAIIAMDLAVRYPGEWAGTTIEVCDSGRRASHDVDDPWSISGASGY